MFRPPLTPPDSGGEEAYPLNFQYSIFNFQFNKHGKERDFEVDAADTGVGDHSDLDRTGRNIVYGYVDKEASKSEASFIVYQVYYV